MKPLVIYHANCADGFGAAYAAWFKLGDEAEYLPVAYGNDFIAETATPLMGREIYILDFSFPREHMEWLFTYAKRVVWLDHHASVMKEWGEGSVPSGVEVRLSNGHVAYVDPDDYDKVKDMSWSEHVKGGAVAYNPSTSLNEYMHHRIIPKKEGFVIDHINRNSLDNRQCNLRYATRSQNGANGVWNETRYKGVTQHGKGFKAQITINYENKVIGTFSTEEEAAHAYDDAARTQWGMFARTNFNQREPFPPNAHVVLDNNKSGAYLAWEYFHPDTEVPQLIKHIDDYDRWQFKLDGTKALNKALWSHTPWSFEQWKNFEYLCGYEDCAGLEGLPAFIREGEAILRAHEQNVASVVKGSARKCAMQWFTREVDGRLGIKTFSSLAANCPPHLTSDVGHELANQSGTYGLCWTLSQTGMIAKCSLRSNGDYDVSAIAKAFGGGGHRNAAGFEVPLQILVDWLK
jgi:hypothetical protein